MRGKKQKKKQKKCWMINGTYGVIWYKYYDERNYYTPGEETEKETK